MRYFVIAVSLAAVLALAVPLAIAPIASLAEKQSASPASKPAENSSAGTPATVPASTTKIIFGGDIMLSRVVGQKMAKSADWSWPLKRISSITAAADIFATNLESPMTIGGDHTVLTGSFSFNADPRAVAALAAAGLDFAALANNHTLNQGAKGIADTAKILSQNKIAFAGAGENAAAAHLPAILERHGIKFAFLSYAYPADNSIAGKDSPGIAGMLIAPMRTDVKNAKQLADVVIVEMHAGTEYANQPNRQQVDFAHAAIAAGADMVIGHHPHVVQTTESYQGKPIIYSLGNLVFDQMWSVETRQGVLAEAEFAGKKISSIKLLPILINDYGQAVFADATASAAILKRMGQPSGLIEF